MSRRRTAFDTYLVRMSQNGYLGNCIGAGHERRALPAEQWRPR